MTSKQKEKASRIFILLGALAWLPFIISRILKIELSVWPFLGVHVICVSTGVLLRRKTQTEQSQDVQRSRIILKNVSTTLLVLGISVWGVYFGLQWITGVEREITPFLIAHLSGVLSGAAIKLYTFFSKR